MSQENRRSLRSVSKRAAGVPSTAWRMFCAVALPDPIRERVALHSARLREIVPTASASWSHEANVHLTLKFIGEVSQSRVEDLSQAAANAVAGLDPFKIVLEETGVFPTHGPPRVLWVGISDPSGRLAELHARLEEECQAKGFAKEERQFHPHLTLARLRKPQGARALAAAHKEMSFESAHVVIADLLVIRSELGSAGAKYSVISRHPFGETV